MRAVKLRTDYLENPLGLQNTSPEFYWNCDGGLAQSAYRIHAYKILPTGTKEQVWDSGEVKSSAMTHIRYEGNTLKSRDFVEWELQLCDEKGAWGESESAYFEIGLTKPADWKAEWIIGNYKPKKNERYPADYFQKNFNLDKKILRARLYISACGLYEATLNSTRVGDFVLAPGSTDYRKRIQYQTYDVTELLQEGKNTLEITLADGWYRGSIGCFGKTNVFGRQTKLLVQLEVYGADGSHQLICSDESFCWSSDGEIRFADLKDGEIIEAGKLPTFSGQVKKTEEKIIPSASDNVAVTEHEHFKGVPEVTPKGKNILNFGQNIAGFVSFKILAPKDYKLHLKLGETLDKDGEFTQENMVVRKPVNEFGKFTEIKLMVGQGNKLTCEMQNTPRQEVEFICSGGSDFYKTKFAIFGFQYALVEMEDEKGNALSDELVREIIQTAEFESIAVYSNLEQTGSFSCSDDRVNRLFSNTLWSMKSNFADVPTDCPTRERLGWTGDAQIFFKTSAYLMNAAPFYRKWLRDMQDNQFSSGKISAVMPYNGLSMLYDNTGSSVGWADAAILIPVRFYEMYGDATLLEENYTMMSSLAEFMIKNAGPKNKKTAKNNPYKKYIYEKGLHLGEWLEPEEFQEHVQAGQKISHTEECTAYMHYTMQHMAKAAHLLKKADDEKRYQEYADGAAEAYRFMFLDKCIPDTDRQAKLVRPLAFGIAEGECKEAVGKRLIEAVERRNYRIGTGFLSTSFVLPMLTELGRADIAYKMLLNEEKPGWLYEVKQCATTIWESWEGEQSRNHYSPGAVCQWLFDGIGGIRIEEQNKFLICPRPDPAFAYAQVSYDSLYGKVESSWNYQEDGNFVYDIIIPPNTTARVELVDGRKLLLEPGRHQL